MKAIERAIKAHKRAAEAHERAVGRDRIEQKRIERLVKGAYSVDLDEKIRRAVDRASLATILAFEASSGALKATERIDEPGFMARVDWLDAKALSRVAIIHAMDAKNAPSVDADRPSTEAQEAHAKAMELHIKAISFLERL